MMCYKDQSWCTAYPMECLNHACRRAVTEKVKAAERKWRGDMSTTALFAWADFSKNCPDKVIP